MLFDESRVYTSAKLVADGRVAVERARQLNSNSLQTPGSAVLNTTDSRQPAVSAAQPARYSTEQI